MAQLQQRVFMVFVRIYQETGVSGSERVSRIPVDQIRYNKGGSGSTMYNTELEPLSRITGRIGESFNVPPTSPNDSDKSRPFNKNEKFNRDYWVLHSVWTSFDEMKANIRPIINEIGLTNVLVGGYIDLALELLPNK